MARVAALQLQNKMLKNKCAAQAKCFRDIRRLHDTFCSKVVKALAKAGFFCLGKPPATVPCQGIAAKQTTTGTTRVPFVLMSGVPPRPAAKRGI